MKQQFFSPEQGLEIAYIDEGNAEEVLVFIHGFASQLDVWERNIEFLSKYYRCIALDLPGHGNSSKGNFPYSQRFYVDVVKAWLEYMQVGRFAEAHLIGHSMGGQISVRTALETEKLWNNLILVAPAGFEQFTESEKILLTQFASVGIFSTSQYWKSRLHMKEYFYDLSEKEYEKLEELNKDFYSLKANPYLAKILQGSIKGMMYEPIFQDLTQLKTRTLICYGRNDKLIPNIYLHKDLNTEDVANAGFKQISDCRLILYKECGHFLQYEYPIQFNLDLYKFLHPEIYV